MYRLRIGASVSVCSLAATGIVAASNLATAQTTLDGITIYATRSERNVLSVPQHVTVVDKEELEKEAITDIDKLVRKVPGIVVSSLTSGTSPFNSFGGFTIRGVGGNRVQIAVDGGRIAERIQDGPRDFVNLDLMKSVSIVRGPASALWGSDAIGGLVAFETLDPEDVLLPGSQMNGEIKTTYDSENNAWKKTGIAAARLTTGLEFLFGYSHIKANEAKRSKARADGGIWANAPAAGGTGDGCQRNVSSGATPCNKLDPTDTRKSTYLAKLVAKPTKNHRFEFTADINTTLTKVDQRWDLGLIGSTTNIERKRELDQKRQRYSLEHNWQIGTPLFESAKWSVSYSPQGYERESRRLLENSRGDLVSQVDTLENSETFYEADIQLSSKFNFASISHHLVYGFDGDFTKTKYKRLDVDTNLSTGGVTVTPAGGFNFANAETTRADFFIQDEIKLFGGILELTPALRYATYTIDPKPDADYVTITGDEPEKISEASTTFKFGTTVNLSRNYSVFGQFAQGFKMPTAQQLYTTLDFGAFFQLVPAPDLQPEKVNNYEIGFRGKFENGFFSINAFYAEYKNFIQNFFEIEPNKFTYRNLSSVQLYGLEGSFESKVTSNLTTYGSFSYQYGDQRAGPGEEKTAFNGAQPLNGVVGVKYFFESYNLEVDLASIWSAPVKRRSSEDLFKPDGYAVFDFNTAWRPYENFEVTASVLNIFDKRYFKNPFPYSYDVNETNPSVLRTNPLELQTAPGRTFRVGANAKF